MKRHELIVILHGLGNSRHIMSGLCWYLKRRGFSVLNIGYKSCSYSSLQLAGEIAEQIFEHYQSADFKSVSIVGFSLGSQLARIIINQNLDRMKFSRLVMLGPPNQSASIARFLRNYLPTSKIWGPVFNELCLHEYPNPSSNVEVGIIAGALGMRMGINPFLKNDNDGLVTVEETLLTGAKEHKRVFAVHGTIPLQPKIMRMTAKFLETGSF